MIAEIELGRRYRVRYQDPDGRVFEFEGTYQGPTPMLTVRGDGLFFATEGFAGFSISPGMITSVTEVF